MTSIHSGFDRCFLIRLFYVACCANSRWRGLADPRVYRFTANQGCYNGFLVVALALGFCLPDPAIARAFTLYGLGCVAVAGIFGALTVQIRILFVQTVPAAAALIALYFSR